MLTSPRLAARELPFEASPEAPHFAKFRNAIAAADRAHPGLGLGAHSHRVAAITKRLCLALGHSEENAELLSSAAYFHDVGKLWVPMQLLTDDRPLDPSERRMIASHAERGAAMFVGDASRFAVLAANMAHWHHQRYDGGGYPGGLAGQDIPMEARIISLADVYDAIRSERAYKGHQSHAQVLHTLLHGDGRIRPGAFDPVILEAFGEVQYDISMAWDCAALDHLAETLSLTPARCLEHI